MIYLFEHVYANKDFYRFIFNNKSQFTYYEMFFSRIKLLVKQAAQTYPHESKLNDFEISYQANAILGIIMEEKSVAVCISSMSGHIAPTIPAVVSLLENPFAP